MGRIDQGKTNYGLRKDWLLMERRLSVLVLTFLLLLGVNLTGAVAAQSEIKAPVAAVDKYGNITLDLMTQVLFDAGFEFGDLVTVQVDEHSITAPFVTAYSDVNVGSELVRGPGGDGAANVMVAINMGNFAGTYGVQEGTEVILTLAEKGTYLGEWLLRQLKRTNNREDYSTDEVFANFRSVAVGRMGTGTYYRSSSPVNDELGRAFYADSLAKAAGIKTVINLADSQAELEQYFAAEGFNSPYYKNLYENGRVILLNMGVDFRSPEFKEKLKAGLEFLIAHDGPYFIHCNEGKDRAGFVSALLEALVGATVTEIKEDYMVTFMNYYGVEYGSEQYDKIAESNILESLRDIAGLPKGASLDNVDLEAAAERYLLGIGLTSEQIETLKDKLTTDAVTANAA
ncbi:MAG: protein tyrosine phosphatase [Firmicutes bacterium]|nr:protein tyrosine phosphatase [Bacillota bacterium]